METNSVLYFIKKNTNQFLSFIQDYETVLATTLYNNDTAHYVLYKNDTALGYVSVEGDYIVSVESFKKGVGHGTLLLCEFLLTHNKKWIIDVYEDDMIDFYKSFGFDKDIHNNLVRRYK